MRTMQQMRYQNNPQRDNGGVEQNGSLIQMAALNNLQVYHDPNVGRGRGRGTKTTI